MKIPIVTSLIVGVMCMAAGIYALLDGSVLFFIFDWVLGVFNLLCYDNFVKKEKQK